MSKQINIREELNRRDMNSCTTDFVNMYECANLSVDKKKSLVKLLSENVSNKRLSKFFEDIDYSNDDYLFKPYWYFTRHGVGPGSVPNYIHVLGVVDANNGSYFASDKVIQTKDLEEYELKEKTPNADDIGEKVRINIQNWLEDPIEENLSNKKLKEALSATKLEQEIKRAIRDFYPGLPDEDYNDLIGDYLVVEIKEENDRTKVEVRAELSYNQMDKLADKLDPIIQKYDNDAYFDHDDSGIISAYLSCDKLTETFKENLKEEYGYYKDEPYCEEIADRLEDGFWSGYTENDTEWDLEINGLSRAEFAPAFADWLAENISYPVRDGHLSYMDLDVFIAKDSIPGFYDSDDAEKLIPDLVKLGIDREDIDNWLKNPNANEELEFWIDYDVNLDVDEWEEKEREEDEFEESLKESHTNTNKQPLKTEDEDLEEDYTHFTYKSGANPYIAKTDKEAQRILNKYKGKVKETKKGFYEIDDTKEDSFITESKHWREKVVAKTKNGKIEL